MSDLNRTILIGRLTRDPELKATPNGTSVCSFTIANGKTFTQNNEKKEQTSFFDCTAWSGLAETISKWCKKGDRIGVEGRLTQRAWKDQEDKWHSKVEVVVENIQFLSQTKKDEQPTQGNTPTGTTGSAPSNPLDGEDVTGKVDNPFADNPFDDNDIAF